MQNANKKMRQDIRNLDAPIVYHLYRLHKHAQAHDNGGNRMLLLTYVLRFLDQLVMTELGSPQGLV